MTRQAFRGALFHCLDDPAIAPEAAVYHDDGGLIVDGGHVEASGPWAEIAPALKGARVTALPDTLIVPGFVDAHVHYPQVDAIGGYGEHLLDWLKDYAFPAEIAFENDPGHARATADFFLDELLRNGTTSALVFATSHADSVDALFEAALARQMRLIAGKVLMDRNAPESLLDTAEGGYAQSRALIEKWQGKGRLGYAVTPRFAPTSTEAQLTLAGRLLAEFPHTLLHTHLCENTDEIKWVRQLFPRPAIMWMCMIMPGWWGRARCSLTGCIWTMKSAPSSPRRGRPSPFVQPRTSFWAAAFLICKRRKRRA